MNYNNSKISSLTSIFKNINKFINKISENNQNLNLFEQELEQIIIKSEQINPWFTKAEQLKTLKYWAEILTDENITDWLSNYNLINIAPKKIGLILAGNIPMVGFHDVLCCLLTNNIAKIKLSSKDSLLIPFILKKWKENQADINFEILERLTDYDLVIATGSENTSTYFEYYFKNIPNIIRKNRTSVAVLDKDISDDDLKFLSEDIFTYFGLGCRNITQIFIPKNFDLDRIFRNLMDFKDIINHNKYANNYDYHKAIFLLNKDKFYDNNFILLKESNKLFSPISVLYYDYYENIESVNDFLNENESKIQCVLSNYDNLSIKNIKFGQAQKPKLNDYADSIDTINFFTK